MIFKLNEKLNKNNLDIEIGDIVEFDQGYIFDKNGNDITEHRFVVVDWDELVPENVFVLMISSGTKNPAKFKYIIDRNGNMTQTTKKAYQYNENIFDGDVDDNTKGFVKCDMMREADFEKVIIKRGKASSNAIKKWCNRYEEAKNSNHLDESLYIRLNENCYIDNDLDYIYIDSEKDGILVRIGIFGDCEDELSGKIMLDVVGTNECLWYYYFYDLQSNQLQVFIHEDDMTIIDLNNNSFIQFNNKEVSKDILLDVAEAFNNMLNEVDVNSFFV